MARSLVAAGIQAIYTSPLARARETAELFGTALGLPITVEPALRERMNWGDVPDQPYEEFLVEWDRCSRDRRFVPTTGDSSFDAGMRLQRFVHALLDGRPETVVVAVAHGGVIADFLLNAFAGPELFEACPRFVAEPYSAEVIPECSVTTVRHDGNCLVLEVIGSIRAPRSSEI